MKIMWLNCRRKYKSSLISALREPFINAFIKWIFSPKKDTGVDLGISILYVVCSTSWLLLLSDSLVESRYQHLLLNHVAFSLSFWRKAYFIFAGPCLTELRIVVEHLIMKPACPLFVRRLCLQSIAFISRLAPTVA